jgi:hypothetical protein
MQFTGTVRNGVIVLENGDQLPEGTRVQIGVLESTAEPESLSTFLLGFAGAIEGLPPDMAEQHDHYLHGGLNRRLSEHFS